MSLVLDIAQTIMMLCALIFPIWDAKLEASKVTKAQTTYAPARKTVMQSIDNSRLMKPKRSALSRPWVVFVIMLLCMAYVLPEVFKTGPLTGYSVYKIVMGVAFFFFVLVQGSISRLSDSIYELKLLRLELFKAAEKKNDGIDRL